MIPEQWCSTLQLLLKFSGRCWWDKDKNQPFDLHMEGWDRAKGGNIKEKNPITRRSSDHCKKKKNTVALKTVIVTKSKRNIYRRTTLLGHCRGRISLHKLVFSLFFLTFSPSLVHCECCIIHWNLVFSPLFINSLYWALWALIHLLFGLRIQNPPL